MISAKIFLMVFHIIFLRANTTQCQEIVWRRQGSNAISNRAKHGKTSAILTKRLLYTPVTNIAMQNPQALTFSWHLPGKMGTFHGFASLPEVNFVFSIRPPNLHWLPALRESHHSHWRDLEMHALLKWPQHIWCRTRWHGKGKKTLDTGWWLKPQAGHLAEVVCQN